MLSEMDTINSDELTKLKQTFNDVTTTFNLQGKTLTQLNSSTYKKEVLAEALITVVDVCQNALNLLDKKNNPQDVVNQIANEVQNVISKMVPQLVADVLKKDENTVTKENIQENEKEKHVIILENKEDTESKYDKKYLVSSG